MSHCLFMRVIVFPLVALLGFGIGLCSTVPFRQQVEDDWLLQEPLCRTMAVGKRVSTKLDALGAMHADGSVGSLVYGNFTRKPHCIFEARPMPGSYELIFAVSAHHAIAGGSMVHSRSSHGHRGRSPVDPSRARNMLSLGWAPFWPNEAERAQHHEMGEQPRDCVV